MNPLFSKDSLRFLEALSFTQTLYAFDFDGTLSPLVSTPAGASVSRITALLMQDLCRKVPVAIVSGRSRSDLEERLPFEPRFIVGNHGLEGLGVRRSSMDEAKRACDRWRASLERRRLGAGVEVEDKTYSLAIHYRRSRNKRSARTEIREVIEKFWPKPRLVLGKSVVNVLPQGAPHKGIATLELMRRAGTRSALYLGDDDTDEDVFGIPDPRIMTVRVGYKRLSQARFFIDRQSQINQVIRTLLRYASA